MGGDRQGWAWLCEQRVRRSGKCKIHNLYLRGRKIEWAGLGVALRREGQKRV